MRGFEVQYEQAVALKKTAIRLAQEAHKRLHPNHAVNQRIAAARAAAIRKGEE